MRTEPMIYDPHEEGDLPSDPLIARAILNREAILRGEHALFERREKARVDIFKRRGRPVEEFQHCRLIVVIVEKVQRDRKVERFVTDVRKMILKIIVAKEWFQQALADGRW